jgi:ApaG protein
VETPVSRTTPEQKVSYSAATGHIKVEVIPEYLLNQSRPEVNYFVWAYHVSIHNLGTETVQLLRRHWIITDGSSHVEHVRGEGVIGQQPILGPGEIFRYSSGCPLRTPTGNMRGWYEFTSETKRVVQVRIPLFFLPRPLAQ